MTTPTISREFLQSDLANVRKELEAAMARVHSLAGEEHLIQRYIALLNSASIVGAQPVQSTKTAPV